MCDRYRLIEISHLYVEVKVVASDGIEVPGVRRWPTLVVVVTISWALQLLLDLWDGQELRTLLSKMLLRCDINSFDIDFYSLFIIFSYKS